MRLRALQAARAALCTGETGGALRLICGDGALLSPFWQPPNDGPLLLGKQTLRLLLPSQNSNASTAVSQPAPRLSNSALPTPPFRAETLPEEGWIRINI